MNQHSKSRNMLLSSALVVVSVSLSLLAGELALRLVGYAGAPESLIRNVRQVDDPILNWRFVPNSTVRDGKLLYHYNSAGFRDLERDIDKPSGTKRMIVLGDSVTEGSGVNEEELFTRHVQNLLGPEYEVLNLGMSGLNTPQEVHLLEVEGLKYGPDAVVVNFVLNDCDFFTEIHAAQRFREEKDAKISLLGDIAIDPGFKRLLKSSALIYFLKARVEHLAGLIHGKVENNYYASLWNSLECRNRITSGFESLKKLQRQHRFVVHVLIWPLLVDYKNYPFSDVHMLVTQRAEESGFKVLDLRDAYASRWFRQLQVTAEDNVHPNGEGHRLAAYSYVEWMRQLSARHANQAYGR